MTRTWRCACAQLHYVIPTRAYRKPENVGRTDAEQYLLTQKLLRQAKEDHARIREEKREKQLPLYRNKIYAWANI